ncbi:DUF624 domain-containing protein [Actinacidiphila paucisporea]|uniref:DUF624 domain-containing protein n=1 Tax=Actinacidiphila paucisporea TaxID=310782 RepID=A0A1M7G1Q5_9ACTN|nr:DUF624 domain-containing protein [Actinacidiphila paucisporea]SHM10008.1 Protein of unknown function, DUF624 [Actinacidiphila paucisporea]
MAFQGSPDARRRGRPGWALSPERGEQVRTAAETMAVGALFLLFALPVVTAGAAWCAAAEVVAGWHRKRELPLLRTFAAVVRRDLSAGLAVEGVLLAVAAATWFEVHVVLGARMPGYALEAAALVLLGGLLAGFVLLAVACRAGAGLTWRDAVRDAAEHARATLSTLPLVVTAMAFTAALIAIVPAFAGFMAGPLAFAVSAVVARNRNASLPEDSDA